MKLLSTAKFIVISASTSANLNSKSKNGVIKLKVKYIGKREVDEPNSYKIFMDVLPDKVYEVLSIENGWYRIVDESGEDYLYPTDKFLEVAEDEQEFSRAV